MNILVSEIHFAGSLSNQDYVELRAALGAIDNDEYKCFKCLRKFDGRSDRDTMLAKTRENKACFGVGTTIRHRLDDVGFQTCVGNFVTAGAYYVVELYGRFAKGIMPFEGSLSSQPNKVIEAFSIIEEWQSKKIEDAEKKRNVKNGLGANTARNRRKV